MDFIVKKKFRTSFGYFIKNMTNMSSGQRYDTFKEDSIMFCVVPDIT